MQIVNAGSLPLARKRVEQRYVQFGKIAHIARYQREVVADGGGGDERVVVGTLVGHVQAGADAGGVAVDRQDALVKSGDDAKNSGGVWLLWILRISDNTLVSIRYIRTTPRGRR